MERLGCCANSQHNGARIATVASLATLAGTIAMTVVGDEIRNKVLFGMGLAGVILSTAALTKSVDMLWKACGSYVEVG